MGPSGPMSARRLFTALLSAITLSIATAALAQIGQPPQEPRPRIWVGGDGYGRFSREAPKWIARDDYDGRYNFCRGYYSSNRPEAGGQGWRTDYPGADNNFSVRLGELSLVKVKMKADGQPDNVVVRLTDPLLYRCPFLFRRIQDAGGRLLVVMAHNTDIPDTWEREGESKEYFDRFSPNGYALGVNIMIYAMTH